MPIRSLTFSPDSQLLITASDDNHIKMYDVYHSIGNKMLVQGYFQALFYYRYTVVNTQSSIEF